jgi:sulfoquinovose isomerase
MPSSPPPDTAPPPSDGWLAAERDRLFRFATASTHPAGGFAWLDDSGSPELDRPVEAWITARMTHVAGLELLLGREAVEPMLAHGVAAFTCVVTWVVRSPTAIAL